MEYNKSARLFVSSVGTSIGIDALMWVAHGTAGGDPPQRRSIALGVSAVASADTAFSIN